MAKTSSVEKNNRRRALAKKYAGKRARLKAITKNHDLPMEERFAAQLKLAQSRRGEAVRLSEQRTDRPAARILQEAKDVASCLTRIGQPGTDPRHGQVKLVRAGHEGDRRNECH